MAEREGPSDTALTSFDLDSLAVGDRLRLFNFTQRDDSKAYLWVLRAMNVLRSVHQVQVHTADVARALTQHGETCADVPAPGDLNLRNMLDVLSGEQDRGREGGKVLHQVEDASRAGALAAYRNRQSVYQFTEIGYRAYTAVEAVIGVRVEDANLSRLVFADILADLTALATANRSADREEIYRKLSRLDAVLEDMTSVPLGSTSR